MKQGRQARQRLSSIVLALAVCGLAAAAAGCWDYRDLERRSSIMGMGVDKTSENGEAVYRVTVEIPRPSGAGPSGGMAQGGGGDGGGGSMPPKVVVSGEGSTFGAALISLSSRIERLPLWEHLLSVVVSESAAREGLSPMIDALARSTMLNSRARLFITENRAEDVIAFLPLMHPLTSQFLRGLEEQFAEFPRFHRPQDVHSLDRLLEETNAALLPRVVLTEGNIVAEGAAVIHHGRLAGWLDPIATEGTNWWLGQVKSAIVEFPCPQGRSAEPVTARARAARSAVTARLQDGLPAFKGTFDVQGRLLDVAHCSLNPENPQDRRRLEASAARTLEQMIRAGVKQAQAMNIDFLHLGLHVRRHMPDVWRALDWEAVFPQVDVEVTVSFAIDDAGERYRAPTYR